jgi:hypothetical protein
MCLSAYPVVVIGTGQGVRCLRKAPMQKHVMKLVIIGCAVLGAGCARGDFVSVLQQAPIGASTSVAFQNSNVIPGTTSADGIYNFLDTWSFSLDGSFLVSSIAAAINFTGVDGHAVLFGISDLQVNLVSNSTSGAPLVSWLAVSAPAAGLQQVVALVPTSTLGAGEYSLEVRGDVTQPGSYSGSLIAKPVQVVPLPETAALFICGIMALGFTARRTRRL